MDQNGDFNVAKVTQVGRDDIAVLSVFGNYNTATQTFTGNRGGVTNNVSLIFQCGYAACDASASVTPTGNTATSNLSGTNAFSFIGQAGNGNIATAKLSGDGGSNGFFNANSDIEQFTDYNTAEVDQTGTAAGLVKIIQGVTTVGAKRGVAIGTPYSTSSAPAVKLGTYPVGANNSATVTQASSADNGIANIYQGADFNLATADQAGTNQFVEIRQDGATSSDTYGNNNAKVTQEIGGSSAQAYVLQNGQSNAVSLTQSAENVTADVAQFGNHNQLTLTQANAGAAIYATQTGNYNTATLLQQPGAPPPPPPPPPPPA